MEWVALTNGAEWRIYNAHAPVPIEDKLFRTVRLRDYLDVAFEVLALLGKDGMRDNRIEELWRSFFVDRQVHAVLDEMFNSGDPARELVNLLARKLPNLSRGDLRDSLMRARASFDFPSAGTAVETPLAAPPAPAPTIRPTAPDLSAPAAARPTKRVVTSAERSTTMQGIMAAGRLRPGDMLVTDYRGCGHAAEMLPDGTLRYAGQAFRSPSAAGEAVKPALLGPGHPRLGTGHRRVELLAGHRRQGRRHGADQTDPRAGGGRPGSLTS